MTEQIADSKQRNNMLWSIVDSFNRLGMMDQVALLTLPLLILYVEDRWYIKIPVVGLSLAGLIFSYLRNNYYYWFGLVCFMAIGIGYTWESADNHKYLITYWCLAIFFALVFSSDRDSLVRSARYLLGFGFGFAMFWKLVSPDFLSGDFFSYTFLFDERFSNKLNLFGALPDGAAEYNRVAMEALITYDSRLPEVDILLKPKLMLWAKILALWTILLEGLITICFLLRPTHRLSVWGDLFLLLFMASTYLVAPVIGFGWVIGTLGFVQCDPARWKVRLSYILMILLLQAYRLPWTAILDTMSSG